VFGYFSGEIINRFLRFHPFRIQEDDFDGETNEMSDDHVRKDRDMYE
jgi:hypothetical protein